MPCTDCQKRHETFLKPGHQAEFTTSSIKDGRQEYADDIEQPHYKGHLNKKWLDIYGASEAKKRGFTESEIKNAHYVYDGAPGLRYYNDRT